MDKFKVGDRVRSIKPVGNAEKVGVYGTIVVYNSDNDFLVHFEEDIEGHHGNSNEYHSEDTNCWWCSGAVESTYGCELVAHETPKPVPKPVEVPSVPVAEVNTEVNIEPCWYCRKGGVVDLYLAGDMGICPKCGRVCNSTLPTVVNTVEPKHNRPLTTDELKSMVGKQVWCSSLHKGSEMEEIFDNEFCGWFIVEKEYIKRIDDSKRSYSIKANNREYGFRAYLTPQNE